MHRNYLKNLLEIYNPICIEEKIVKRRMLEFLTVCTNCFERSCMLGHFTASSWLVNSNLSKVLLMHHKKLDKWQQLGGHCDGDGNVLRVSIKEACEESGIDHIVPLEENIFDIDMHLTPQIKQEPPHYHFDIRFLLKVNGNDKVTMNQESKSLIWFSPDKRMLPTSSTSILRMLGKWNQYRENVKLNIKNCFQRFPLKN